ncbi:MAG: alcohol dehydrogenase catalytic domain-containing protein [Oscillibacter sp.]|nr:alcohol dehydrogenase catalytic domain-containing protein [Oscillibacter sp.]
MEYPSTGRIAWVTAPHTVEIRQRDIRPLAPHEVLIQIRASALCGSDLHTVRGKHPSVSLPSTIGHEFSGDVVAIGEAVSPARLGQRVTVEPCTACGTCESCRSGRYDLCGKLRFLYRDGDGAMADYILVNESSLFPLPDAMSYDEGALMEPLSVSIHAVRRGGVSSGDSVFILGDGPIGILTAAACRLAGAERILLAGHSPARLALAKSFGATETLNAHDRESAEWVLDTTGGVAKSFECVGSEGCFEQATRALRPGGVAVIAGIYEEPHIRMDISRLITRKLSILGTQSYCHDFPRAIAAAASIPLKSLISHTFPIDRLGEALETAMERKRETVKIVIHP